MELCTDLFQMKMAIQCYSLAHLGYPQVESLLYNCKKKESYLIIKHKKNSQLLNYQSWV